MAYTITDIAELVRYHLVLAEPDDERADANLAQLVQWLEQMASRPLWREASWVFCDRCGCSVDTDLIHPDGHHYADDGRLLLRRLLGRTVITPKGVGHIGGTRTQLPDLKQPGVIRRTSS